MNSHQDTKTPRAPSPELDVLARLIVDSAYTVHKRLGPGLLESLYEACLAHELGKRNVQVARQVSVPVTYDEMRFEAGFRIDLLVDEKVVVEVKATDTYNPVFEAQLLTYLKLTGCRLGLLINFNVPQIRDGIRRRIL